MENKLAENIRTFRKQRALTQEQLAEVLGRYCRCGVQMGSAAVPTGIEHNNGACGLF